MAWKGSGSWKLLTYSPLTCLLSVEYPYIWVVSMLCYRRNRTDPQLPSDVVQAYILSRASYLNSNRVFRHRQTKYSATCRDISIVLTIKKPGGKNRWFRKAWRSWDITIYKTQSSKRACGVWKLLYWEYTRISEIRKTKNIKWLTRCDFF
jgi:hypothetical protein